VPIGRPRVEFNPHRIVEPSAIPSLLDEFELIDFAAVVDQRVLEEVSSASLAQHEYAFDLYHLQRS
jgi:hypothetical protein